MALDWRHHVTGDLRPCRYCRRPAFMRDEAGRPCHKNCAEQAVADSTGGDGGGSALVIALPVTTSRRRQRRIA